MNDTTELVLTGPEGANPLGFLCALGVLRTLDHAWPAAGVKMAWQQNGARWRPVLRMNADLENNIVVDSLCKALEEMSNHPALSPKNKDGTLWTSMSVNPSEFREYARRAYEASSQMDKRWVDFVAAFGCECIAKKDKTTETYMRLVGVKQQFLESIRRIIISTHPEHVREALYGPWLYQQDGRQNHTLRWDPAEYRKHAYRWNDPNADKIIGTERGAYRLAIEALPFFPSMPCKGAKLKTTGFSDRHRFLTWPIWSCFLSSDAVRSIIGLAELQEEKVQRRLLIPMGIAEIFRAERVYLDESKGEGGYKNFTPAQPV
jgi:hypothetical protein